jgi:hypothetical protein
MAMITPLSDTGNVRSLKHSSHILILFFIVILVNAVQNYKKDCLCLEKNIYFCGLPSWQG